MKKVKLVILLTIFLSNLSFSQEMKPLYKGLLYNMPIENAKKELKKNIQDYNNISFGNGIVWEISEPYLIESNGKLSGLGLLPKNKILGLKHENAKVYLQNSRKFFESKGYIVLKEPDNWDIPVLFSQNNLFGLLLHNPDKSIMIDLRSIKSVDSNYIVILTIMNYDIYIKGLDAMKNQVKKEQDNTGF